MNYLTNATQHTTLYRYVSSENSHTVTARWAQLSRGNDSALPDNRRNDWTHSITVRLQQEALLGVYRRRSPDKVGKA